jgi:polar amino acid transport system substrate-binding protein
MLNKIFAAVMLSLMLASCASSSKISPAAIAELAPNGTLRAGINLGNGVIATRDPVTGEVRGIAVNIARELGRRIGVPVELVVYAQAAHTVAGGKAGAWDVTFLAIDPLRAQDIAYTAPYAEIEGTYLVRADSPIRANADVDREGVRVLVVAGSNYDLFLTRNLKHAMLVRAPTTQGSADQFAQGTADVLAGVKQRIEDAAALVPGSRQLAGRFMAIRQAIGVPKGRDAALQYVREFVENIKASGMVAREIEAAGVRDAIVAPLE